jgi:hypothetical protein
MRILAGSEHTPAAGVCAAKGLSREMRPGSSDEVWSW